MSILSKLIYIYTYNTIPIKIPPYCSAEMDKLQSVP